MLLLTGSGGFIGRAVMTRAGLRDDAKTVPLARDDAARAIAEARAAQPAADISLLNLAWPSLKRYAAKSGDPGEDDAEWREFASWTDGIARAAAAHHVRFFQAGSGVEPYAVQEPPALGEPYLTYGRRKDALWRRIASIPALQAHRLRIHFIFGPGEAPGRLVPAAIRASRARAPFEIGALERRRCWLHIDDLADGLIEAAFAPAPENWDIAGPDPLSFADLIEMIAAAAGGAATPIPPKTAPADAACPEVAPENVAPFMRQGPGSLENLQSRLHDYAASLD